MFPVDESNENEIPSTIINRIANENKIIKANKQTNKQTIKRIQPKKKRRRKKKIERKDVSYTISFCYTTYGRDTADFFYFSSISLFSRSVCSFLYFVKRETNAEHVERDLPSSWLNWPRFLSFCVSACLYTYKKPPLCQDPPPTQFIQTDQQFFCLPGGVGWPITSREDDLSVWVGGHSLFVHWTCMDDVASYFSNV